MRDALGDKKVSTLSRSLREHGGNINKSLCGLELVVDAEADDVVSARIGLGAIAGLLVVVAVEADEVAGIETNFLVDVPDATESDAVAVAGERCISLIFIGESIVCALATTAYC